MSIIRSCKPFRPTRTTLLPMSSTFFRQSHPLGLGLAGFGSLKLSSGPVTTRAYRSGKAYKSYARDNMAIIYGLIGLQCSVFAYYQFVKIQAEQGMPRPLISFAKNFTLNLSTFRDDGRWWTALTSTITHFGAFHLISNMVSMYYLGQLVAYTPTIGPARLVGLIVGSGLAGSAGYLYQRKEILGVTGGRDNRRAIGFSGAVMGVGAAAACMYPRTQFALYGVIPVPLWALMGGYFLYDGVYLNNAKTGVAHAGHLGGLAFGLLYYFTRLRGLRL